MSESPKILVVEDEAYVQGMLEDFLRRQDYEVRVVATAEEAFSALKTEEIQLVLLDKNLPDMSGVEVLSQIRFEDPNLPVIFMTGYPSERSKLLVHHLGISAYFEKPVDLKALADAIRRALEGEEAVWRAEVPPLELVASTQAEDLPELLDLVLVTRNEAMVDRFRQAPLGLETGVLCSDVDELYDLLQARSAHVLAVDLDLLGSKSLAAIRWATERHPTLSVLAFSVGSEPTGQTTDLLQSLNVRYVLDGASTTADQLAAKLDILVRRSRTLRAIQQSV